MYRRAICCAFGEVSKSVSWKDTLAHADPLFDLIAEPPIEADD